MLLLMLLRLLRMLLLLRLLMMLMLLLMLMLWLMLMMLSAGSVRPFALTSKCDCACPSGIGHHLSGLRLRRVWKPLSNTTLLCVGVCALVTCARLPLLLLWRQFWGMLPPPP